MNELRVCIESTQATNEELLSAWFTLPIDEEEFLEKLGVDAESENYRIVDKALPFSDDVREDTSVERLNDLYSTYASLPADLQEDCAELLCWFTDLDELHSHRNDIIHYSWCKNMADVAKHLLDHDPTFAGIEERLIKYFDFEAYGQYLDDNGHFVETEHGIYELP
ncbi:antirestriction protein [Faecalibacillus intestinalis]|uniref:Antirestriction protein n=1 Tax=Faecalibacillus intestinalis TaxID=1982626 RepID=A0A7I8E3N2_9FIRM|nr:antirestriction protein ArdA [Faecalibacillus intestinalis]BCL58643.1 antirestriction protein [Faecalibacillus intestinalis]